MLKLVLIGVWIAVATAISVYGTSAYLDQSASEDGDGKTGDLGGEQLKTEMTSIPMIRGGEILGYVIMQLTFVADRERLQVLAQEPQPYLVDAAFRTVFSNPEVDFRRLRKGDLDTLTREIAGEANSRLGSDVVRDVLIEQLNYVRREDIRTNWISKSATDH